MNIPPLRAFAWVAGCATVHLLTFEGVAGDKTVVTQVETVSLSDPWEFKLGIPGWIAGVWGDVGVRGRSVRVDVSPETILEHLNFTAAFNAEVRKGRFGVYADFLYLSAQSGTPTPGLVARIDLRVDQVLADLDLNWRLMEGPCGWVDVLVGVRYINLYERLGLNPNNGAIARASERFVDAATSDVGKLLDQALHGVLDGKDPALPVPPLAGGIRDRLLGAIEEAKRDPALAAAMASGDPARISAAETKVERKIARILERELSRSFSLNKWWFDPYLGVRAQFNLSRALYLKAKADIGGFSVGSRITCEAYGAVGCQITRTIYSEAGYRYLYVDYRRNGFIYNVSTGGAQVTVEIAF
jgi:hypothetical protein